MAFSKVSGSKPQRGQEVSASADLQVGCAAVTGLFLSNENTIGPAIDVLALVLREASRDR